MSKRQRHIEREARLKAFIRECTDLMSNGKASQAYTAMLYKVAEFDNEERQLLRYIEPFTSEKEQAS